MKRRKKILISAMSVMLIMVLAATIISFTLADNDNESVEMIAATQSDTIVDTVLSNVDYVIKKTSVDGAQRYRIVEIGSSVIATSSDASSWSTFVSSGDFKEYVIDGNRTIDEVMKEGMVEYQYYAATDVTDTNEEALAYIANADMIYISCNADNPYAGANDIGEELYNFLHIYAVGDYKSFIIDSPVTIGNDEPQKENFSTFIGSKFLKSGSKYNAAYWPTGMAVTNFLNPTLNSSSFYKDISGKVRRPFWQELQTEGTTKSYMADVLVVSANGGTLGTPSSVNGALLGDIYASSATGLKYVDGSDVTLYTNLSDWENPVASGTDAPATGPAITQSIYSMSSGVFYTNGYKSTYVRPDYARVTEIKLTDITSDMDLDKFDAIILESDCGAQEVSVDIQNKLQAAMLGGVKFIYDQGLGTAVGDSSPTIDFTGTNYKLLYDMVSTTDGLARYTNILVTSGSEMETILNSKSAQTCKKIADIINGGSFRGIGGPSSASTSFTVLEIEPCYPIDLNIATAKKAYYDDPANVINNMTKEEIDGNNSNNAYKEWKEYYDWDISAAKIADALNMDVKDITVVHMSSEELQANKTEILGTYDLIYFGGNSSALKSLSQYRSLAGLTIANGTSTIQSSVSNIKYMPVYTMYAHNGDVVNYDNSYLSQSGNGGLAGGTLIGAVPGHEGDRGTFALFNGNDISVENKEAIYEYVLAGMPIMFSDDVANAYSACLTARDVDQNVYLQNSIDPDSNVFKLLSLCYAISEEYSSKGIVNSNIYWGLDATKDIVYTDNDGGRLGNTLTGQVEVMNQTNKKALYDTYLASNHRPKLVVTSMPPVYNMYDETTKMDTKTLSFAYDVTGVTNYTVNLYIDYDLNSKFTSDEIVGTSNSSTLSVNLAAKEGYGENYFGPVYWQLELIDNSSKRVIDSTTSVYSNVLTNNICYIKKGDGKPQSVKVLQIIPENSTGPQGATTLLFCTQCQRSLEVLKYNPYTSDNTGFTKAGIYDSHIGNYVTRSGASVDANGNTLNKLCNDSDVSINMGRHEHQFGIVQYDSVYALPGSGSVVGMDDWDTNLAYEVHNLYNFDLDILTSREFEAMDKQVKTDLAAALALAYPGKTLEDLSETELSAFKTSLTNAAFSAEEAYEASKTATKTAQAELDALILTMCEDATAKATAYSTDNGKVTTWADVFARLSAKTYYAEAAAKGVDISNYSNFYFDYFTYVAPKHITNVTGAGNEFFHYEEYKTKYSNYVKAKDAELALKDVYKQKNRLAHYDNWLSTYSSVIIGPAENFAGDDIKDADALASLKNYILNNGNILMFHETLCVTSDKGAKNLTSELRALVGQDKNHMTLDEDKYVDIDKTVYYDELEKFTSAIDYSLTITAPDGTKMELYNHQLADLAEGKVNNVSISEFIRTDPTYNHGYSPWTKYDREKTEDQTDNTATDSVLNISLSGTQETAVGISDQWGNVTLDEVQTVATNKPIDYTGYTVTLTVTTGDYYNNGFGEQTYTATVSSDGKVSFTLPREQVVTKSINYNYTKSDYYYLPYKSIDDEKYFLTNLSYRANDDELKYAAWKDDMKKYYSGFGPKYLSANAFTDSINLAMTANGGTNAEYSNYPYASLQWGAAAEWSNSANSPATAGTDRASLNNKSVLTMYPFTLSDELYVSGTHASSFAIDIEDEDMTVLYSLAGGNLGKTESSVYAASPHDGTDSYFIYNYGNVNYCGAGHYEITGEGKKNNDERRLYINIICNSVTNLPQTELKIYDYNTTKNDVIKKVDNINYDYLYEIPSDDNAPEFSFKASLETGVTVQSVKVYYDIDADYTFSTGDVIITQYGTEFTQNTLINVPDTLSTLRLDGSYLTNGRFVYIVVEVKDSNGKTTKKRMRVEKAADLFNLT